MTAYTYTGEDPDGVKREGNVPGSPFSFAIAWLDADGHWLSVYDETGAEVAGVQHFGGGHYEAWTAS